MTSLQKQVLLLWVPIAMISVSASAQPAETQWKAAGAAYVRGAYEEAWDEYRALEQAGYRSASLFYNMGNTAYRLGKTGPAVLYFQKARHLRPTDQAIAHNLALVQEGLRDQIIPLRPFFLFAWWKQLYLMAPAWLWAALGLGAWLAAVALLARDRLGLDRSPRWLGPGIALGLGLLMLGLAWSRHSWDVDPGLAVVMTAEAEMRVAPDPESARAKTLHEGTTVRLQDSLENWWKVSLPNGEQGWLLNNTMARIP